MMKVINLTPHSINLYKLEDCVETTTGNYKSLILKDGATPLMVLPSSGVARASATKIQATSIEIDGVCVPVNETSYGEVEGLPPETPDTVYLVSALTAQAAKGRNDLIIVDSTVRDSSGRIIGCTSFGRI